MSLIREACFRSLGLPRSDCRGFGERKHLTSLHWNPDTAMSKHSSLATPLFVLLVAAAVDCTWAEEPSAPFPAKQLVDRFVAPPAEFRPLIIVHSALLGRDDAVDWLAARHAGGAVVDAGVAPGSKDVGGEPTNNPTYLNDPGRFTRLGALMARMEQRGQRVWIYDELGYPSASAGGRVLADHPEFQVEVVACRTTAIDAGRTAEIVPELGPVLACFAMPHCDGALQLDQAVNLTSEARRDDLTPYR